MDIGNGAFPLAERSIDPDSAAVELDEPLGEREAEAGPFPLLDPGFGLLELGEDSLVILGREPGASVRGRYGAEDFTTSRPRSRISSLPSATPFLVREAGTVG